MMKLNLLVFCMAATTVTSTHADIPDAAVIDKYMETLSMAGIAGTSITDSSNDERLLRGSGAKEQGKCPPGLSTDLIQFPQWKDEVGYWIGEYTLLQGDGNYTVSASWPYPYKSYTGFITGTVVGNAYRQRNVFLYPPSQASPCDSVVGEGKCGENGNSLVFAADQSGCSLDGGIAGSFLIGNFPIDTTTELVGADNALLYQVSIAGTLTQSQLTTITKGTDGTTRRTRTAQSFGFGTGLPAGTSYYREVNVSKEEFYERLEQVIAEYGILEADLCVRDGFTRAPRPDYVPGIAQCKQHLEQSFEL
ncbi:unnamed protein product [Cylindrotheca closterium]|uniref:Uncharacterized protein n=1 Tax=Cylindrotheca closterium TaxID=2856 RepID=A0AAD2JH32_9STRA|nr:unnamed protein product [Cylindrotheca closterium]